MAQTLGQRLREQQAARTVHGAITEQHRRLIGEERFKANEDRLRVTFRDMRTKIISDIDVGNIPDPPQMSSYEPFQFGYQHEKSAITPDNERHPYHHIWLEFDGWLAENDLQVTFEWKHDGGGEREWYDADVNPRETK